MCLTWAVDLPCTYPPGPFLIADMLLLLVALTMQFALRGGLINPRCIFGTLVPVDVADVLVPVDALTMQLMQVTCFLSAHEVWDIQEELAWMSAPEHAC